MNPIYAGQKYVAWFDIENANTNIPLDSTVTGSLINDINPLVFTYVIIPEKNMTWNAGAEITGRWELVFETNETNNIRMEPPNEKSQLRWQSGYIEVQVFNQGIASVFHTPVSFGKALN